MGILARLYSIARSNFVHYTGTVEKLIDQALNPEKPFSRTESGRRFQSSHSRFRNQTGAGNAYRGYAHRTTAGQGYGEVPRQVVEDLAVFNLKPPSSLEEVRKARNREIKKYHSDKFINDPEKLESSKQIMQIYNTAYDRLKKYYASQKP